MQFYEGRADWDAIRAVREVISIPLIANGDVETAGDAQEILRRSGADAVMALISLCGGGCFPFSPQFICNGEVGTEFAEVIVTGGQ